MHSSSSPVPFSRAPGRGEGSGPQHFGMESSSAPTGTSFFFGNSPLWGTPFQGGSGEVGGSSFSSASSGGQAPHPFPSNTGGLDLLSSLQMGLEDSGNMPGNPLSGSFPPQARSLSQVLHQQQGRSSAGTEARQATELPLSSQAVGSPLLGPAPPGSWEDPSAGVAAGGNPFPSSPHLSLVGSDCSNSSSAGQSPPLAALSLGTGMPRGGHPNMIGSTPSPRLGSVNGTGRPLMHQSTALWETTVGLGGSAPGSPLLTDHNSSPSLNPFDPENPMLEGIWPSGGGGLGPQDGGAGGDKHHWPARENRMSTIRGSGDFFPHPPLQQNAQEYHPLANGVVGQRASLLGSNAGGLSGHSKSLLHQVDGSSPSSFRDSTHLLDGHSPLSSGSSMVHML